MASEQRDYAKELQAGGCNAAEICICDLADDAIIEVATLRSLAVELVGALGELETGVLRFLSQYGRHTGACGWLAKGECDCGYADVHAAVHAALRREDAVLARAAAMGIEKP